MDPLTTPVYTPTPVDIDPGWNADQLRQDSERIRDMEEEHRRILEEHSASIWTGISGAWRHETGTGILLSELQARQWSPDISFDLNKRLSDDKEEFNPAVKWEQDTLKEATSEAHYDFLKNLIRDKREFLLNAEDLGILPTMGLQVIAEFANLTNHFSFGLAGLQKANKLRRFLVAGAVTSVTNMSEEAYINQMYHDRTAADYIASGAWGMGLGWLGTLGGDASKAKLKEINKATDYFANTHIRNSVDETADNISGQQRPGAYRQGTAGAARIDDIYKALDPEFNPDKTIPHIDAESDFVQRAYSALINKALPQAKRMWHETFGLASMGQSVHASDNPLARYMAAILMEFPEGVGRWNDHTIALKTDLDFHKAYATYAPEFIRLKSAWNTLKEQIPEVTHSFDEAATLWIDGAGSVKGATKEMDDILAKLDDIYTKVNEETIRRLRRSGSEEAHDNMNPKHLTRSWDGKRVADAKNKYGDKTVIETFRDSILKSTEFQHAFTKALDKEDVFGAINKIEDTAELIGKAMYNRFLKRAVVTTKSGADFLSTGNIELLMDAIKDLKPTDAEFTHVKKVIDTMVQDRKQDPFKHRVPMDLSYQHPSGLRVLDMMYNDLGSTFMASTRTWLAKANAAEMGIVSEEYFNNAIEQIRKHGHDRGMDPKDIQADVDRLQAAWKLVKGEPLVDMSDPLYTAMRVARKLMAAASLGKLGIVQSGETGRVLAAGGIKNLMAGIPAMRDMIMDIKDGRLNTAALKDFEDAIFGTIGDDHYMNHPDFRADDFGYKVHPWEQQLDRFNFWLMKASGQHLVHTQQKKWLMNALAQKWRREFLNGTITETQLKDLGVPIHHIPGITEMLKKHARMDPETRSYNLNIGKWDEEYRRTFALMLHRKTNNAIQDIMVGETPLWLNKPMGKFLGQFRTFSIAALGKQTIHDYKMWKDGDKEAALAFQFMLATSAMAVAARTAFDSMSQPAGERLGYLADNLDPRALATQILRYHGQAGPLLDMTELLATSVTPDAWGTLTGSSMYKNGRGLSGKIPGMSYLDKAQRGVTGLGRAITPGLEMKESDWNALVGSLPFGNWFGTQVINNTFIKPAIGF